MKKKPSKMEELTFQHLENSVVILCRNGSYSQHQAYIRRGEVFAKVGAFYVGLRRHGTSKPGYNIVDMDLGGQERFAYTATGRVVLAQHADADTSIE